MKKIYNLLFVIVMLFTITACNGKTEEETVMLKTNFAGENDKRTFTYLQANPLTMPDGTVINSGDLKPVWQYIEKQLNIDINDVANASTKAQDTFDLSASQNFENAHIHGGANLGQRIMNEGVKGSFIAISDHMNKMPDLKAYLEANPLVKSAITASDGKIYHVPYIAEINNYARMFIGRYSWVTAVLDEEVKGEPFTLETETATLTVAYEAYWKSGTGLPYGGLRKTKNVIDLQNAAAVDGKLTREKALSVLKSYINETYPELTKPSQLYLGETARYDIDELVALWRVLKLSPKTLSKEASGVAKADAVIWPYFVRQTTYREEFIRLMSYFGGMRIHGSDSYGSKFYLDHNGVLQFSYYQDDFIANLGRLRQIFKEGLVDEKIAGAANTTNLRSDYIFKDGVETNKVYGFMTYDWASSTTAATGGQDDVKAFLPPLTTTPISNGQYIHWVENTRVVKPDGWGISHITKGKELNAALKLFNYFFTEEGSKVQNYGTPDLWVEGEEYTNPTDGVKGPLFNDWTRTTAGNVTNGDISSFLRDHIGALIPLGYQKVIGFELQSTSENGMWSWDLYYGANDGKGVKQNSYQDPEPFYQLVPPVFALTENELQIVQTTTSMTSDTSLTERIFGYIGGSTEPGIPTTAAEVKAMYTDAGVVAYINIYRQAYARMTGQSE